MTQGALATDAFVRAFGQHGRALWLIAAAWVGRTDADDLVQETARIAWERRAQFTTGDDPRAWLAAITRHLGANWRRKRRPTATDDQRLDRVHAELPRALHWPFDADAAGLDDRLARALAALGEVARSCLLLHVVHGMSMAEIATLMDLPENTVASHVRRARLAMRAALELASILTP